MSRYRTAHANSQLNRGWKLSANTRGVSNRFHRLGCCRSSSAFSRLKRDLAHVLWSFCKRCFEAGDTVSLARLFLGREFSKYLLSCSDAGELTNSPFLDRAARDQSLVAIEFRRRLGQSQKHFVSPLT